MGKLAELRKEGEIAVLIHQLEKLQEKLAPETKKDTVSSLHCVLLFDSLRVSRHRILQTNSRCCCLQPLMSVTVCN
jgi:hypothetical protein